MIQGTEFQPAPPFRGTLNLSLTLFVLGAVALLLVLAITIHFYSLTDFDKIINILKK